MAGAAAVAARDREGKPYKIVVLGDGASGKVRWCLAPCLGRGCLSRPCVCQPLVLLSSSHRSRASSSMRMPRLQQTSLIHRFAQEHFKRQYKQTIGADFYLKRVELPGDVHVAMHLCDIGGQSLGSRMLPRFLHGADVSVVGGRVRVGVV